MKTVLNLSPSDAREYFLKQTSYINFDLPEYFQFGKLLLKIDKKISWKSLSNFHKKYKDSKWKTKDHQPQDFENVNYLLLNNKDWRFAWRPFQIIHPAIYVALVHEITKDNNWKIIQKRFKEFQKNKKIKCYSLPLKSDNYLSDRAASVNQWWQMIEQKSLELAVRYDYLLVTDITDCYWSIYTHSIPWAIHWKSLAKSNRHDFWLIWNTIDKKLRDMSFGQTNWIPQWSTLMDFIAEIVLGYADLELSKRIKLLKIKDYEIIRYRDDYRIFTNNPQDAELITKNITEIMIELWMRLNNHKTSVSNNIIKDSIKADKLYWLNSAWLKKSLQQSLMIIHELSLKYPNSWSLNKSLTKFYSKIEKIRKTSENIKVLISILIDIAYKNPRTYPIISAILSKLLSLLSELQQNEILSMITKKFEKIPNTGHLKIWLQRITVKINRSRNYDEPLCKKVNDPTIKLWNSDWLDEKISNLIDWEEIVNEITIAKIDRIIKKYEIALFASNNEY